MEGRCTCGAVTYRLTDTPMVVHCCHCSWCQRETGSAFVINAVIERTQLTVAGDYELVPTASASGKGQEIARCPACRVALWSHYAGSGRRTAFVRVGTLDDPAACPPDVHIFTGSKQPWVVLPDSVPAFADFYPTSEGLWSEAARARWAAVRALPEPQEPAGARPGDIVPILFVADVPRAAAWYRDTLGFAIEFLYGDPPFYGAMRRGGARLHLRHVDAPNFAELAAREESLILATIETREVAALYAEAQAHGAAIVQPLAAQPWGGTDFQVRDPDGNRVSFVSYAA